MKVLVHRRAARALRRLPADEKDRIKARLRDLASDPTNQSNVQAMKGRWSGYHRLRIGAWRVIFQIDRRAQVIHVDHIGSRGDVYK